MGLTTALAFEYGYFQREDGTPLHYMLVNLKGWCKNHFEVIHQLRESAPLDPGTEDIEGDGDIGGGFREHDQTEAAGAEAPGPVARKGPTVTQSAD